jgi:microcystin-dependent protein
MYLTCKQTTDITSNTSTIAWTLTVTGGNATYYTTGPTTVNIGGQTVYYKDRLGYTLEEFPTCPGSVSGSLKIEHDNEGNKTVDVSIATAIYNTTVRTTSDTWELDSIPRYATIKTATNFTDEQNPVITYSNPAGSAVSSLRACISLDGTNADIEYRDISKTETSYTFVLTDAERDILRAATPNSNKLAVKFYVRSVIGGQAHGSNITATMSIVNANPTLSPMVEDTNSATIAVTGNKNILVASQSVAKVTINAAAQKYATIKSKKVEHNGKTLTADGTFSTISNSPIKFTATDSRGNSTVKNATNTIVPYISPTCYIGNNMPTTDGTYRLAISGQWYNGSIGATANTLTVKYRYKTAGGSYGSWVTISNPTLNGNAYSAAANITGLDYQSAYTFQAQVNDKLVTATSSEKTVIATPVFDWGSSDFQFHVPVYDRFGTQIGNGLAAYTGGGDAGIDPNTTLESLCLTSHTNAPQGLGTFFFICTAFYNAKATNEARTQIAFPYRKAGSIYYRYYTSGSWSPWERNINASEILDMVYPVGSYYISHTDTSPASLFGGTWHRIESRFLWAAPASSTLGLTAGEQTHTLTADEMPEHSHNGLYYSGNNDNVGLNAGSIGYKLSWSKDSGKGVEELYTGDAGRGAAHNNMPPYVNVAIWRRTA